MHQRSDIVYLYDGSLEGLLCCIFESYEKKEIPMDIRPENSDYMAFYETKMIDTDFLKAGRVKEGIKRKASQDVYDYAEYAYFTCHPTKEMLILNYIRLSMKHGRNILSMLTDDTVKELFTAVNSLRREAHQLEGFIRFSIYSDIMIAVIEPKNFALSLLAPHFCDRYSNETFMIYDKTHGQALIYQTGKSDIISLNGFNMPEVNGEETKNRLLWKLFYDTIAIEGRYNPKCRQTHMQKRFWKHLTEMDDNITRIPVEKGNIFLTAEMKAIGDKEF